MWFLSIIQEWPASWGVDDPRRWFFGVLPMHKHHSHFPLQKNTYEAQWGHVAHSAKPSTAPLWNNLQTCLYNSFNVHCWEKLLCLYICPILQKYLDICSPHLLNIYILDINRKLAKHLLQKMAALTFLERFSTTYWNMIPSSHLSCVWWGGAGYRGQNTGRQKYTEINKYLIKYQRGRDHRDQKPGNKTGNMELGKQQRTRDVEIRLWFNEHGHKLKLHKNTPTCKGGYK